MKSFLKITGSLSFIALLAFAFSFLSQEPSSQYTERQSEVNSNDMNGAQTWYKKMRADVRTGEMNYDLIKEVRNEVLTQDAAKRAASNLRYSFVGPSNEGGRTRAILVDMDDSERIYAGGVSGGLFVSDNGGNNWTTDWDFFNSLLISSICQTQNGDIYVGTGCSHENGNFGGGSGADGIGVYKSTDKGETWTILESTENWSEVNHLEAHPTNANVVFAATGSNLQISQDGGTSWSNPMFIDPACSIPRNGECQHVQFNSDGSRVFVGMNGTLFQSDNPLQSCSYEPVGAPFPGGSERIMVATSAADDEIVYAACINPANNALLDIYQSKDGGDNWASMDPNVPRSSPNYDHFGESRGSGQGWYDFSFAASPADAGVLFIGGVQMWRFDGNWTLAAAGRGRFNMHVDHHTITFDKNNPNIVFFGHDGGLSKSLDGGYTFFDMDNGYQTTQFYGIAASKQGIAIGGTQDNGNIIIDPSVFGTPDFGIGVSNQGVTNGDGFDVEISNIVDAKFTTAQSSSAGRSRILDQLGAAIIPDTVDGTGAFNTIIRLWESENDIYSRDSIDFVVDTSDQVFAVANGSQKQFTGTIEAEQASANVVYNSVYVSAGVSRAHDFDGDGVLEGDGTGTVNSSTGVVSVTWDVTPQTNTQIKLHYTANYNAGSVLNLESKTEALPVRHVLKFDLNPGDHLLVQDPIQSLVALNTGWNPNTQANGNGIMVTRNGLRFNEEIKWTFLPGTGQTTCMQFSEDGKHLFYGTGGGLFRVSGMENIYYPMNNQEVSDAITITRIYSGSNVAGFDINPNDPSELIVTLGGYGRGTNVAVIDNIENRSTASAGRSIQGDMPAMPVFDAEYNINNPNQIVLGTDFGVYVTEDYTQIPTVWTHEVTGFSHAPVYDVRQQRYPGASNEGVIYFGTHGRGIWSSASLVGETEHTDFGDNSPLGDMSIYPNPMNTNGFIGLTSDKAKEVDMRVYNIKGDLVKFVQDMPLQEGRNEIPFNASNLKPGAYIISLENNTERSVSKFIVNR